MTTTLPIAALPAADSAAEARSVLDMQGLDSLKLASAQTPNDPKTLRAVAQQFESLFIGMMLKSMRDAKLGDGLFAAAEAVKSVGPGERDVVFVFCALRKGIQHGQGIGEAFCVVKQEGLGAEGVAVVGGELED